ncbi:YozE family protein [Bacillus sp. FJAT-49736]|uniref:YozE family protein n=1 Tax=Bacillus sp. FJAT-49736 TaxID=2833582 RepID=UPI001BC944F2|nr:YozE family protein [Bacillus sp. FJAT-49736]MBS4173187.1 YozE family protein [Bacillus sp. FJAT-49736]
MNLSFYHYLMKYRDAKAKDDISLFANHAYNDHAFPKHSNDYHELSSYLEMNGAYLESMSIFDKVWELYLLEANK